MAETYPLDLAGLKRTIDTAEQMVLNVDQTDLTVEQRLNLFKDAFVAVQNAYNTAGEANKDEFNALIDRVQSIGNDLKEKIEALNTASETDLEALAEQLTAVKTLLEGDAGATIIKTLDTIADTINATRISKDFVAVINDNTGKATVDITALGLANTSDFKVVVSQNVTSAFALATIGARKVDEKTIEIVAYDNAYTPETRKLYDGSTTPITVDVEVIFVPVNPISIGVTHTDGTTEQVGN